MAIGLFIDGAYVYKTYGTTEQLDYVKLRAFLEKELSDKVDEGYFFNADDDPPKAQKLHNALTYPPPQGAGLRTKIYWIHKELLYWPQHLGGHPVMHPTQQIQFELKTQKAVDVGLAFHMVRSFYKRNWSKLVLAAGDGDFHEPIQSLVENENVDLYLVGSTKNISPEISPYAKTIFEIDKEPLHNNLRLQKRQPT